MFEKSKKILPSLQLHVVPEIILWSKVWQVRQLLDDPALHVRHLALHGKHN